jgi:2,4-dienoyl-CoA reductase-like NADH-dependent reductase (Old Yellow Enzyme family)
MTMFRELFEPMTVGPMQVVNRIMMSAMSAGMMLDKDGQITPEMIAYFIERVRNNPGMAAVGACAVVPDPRAMEISSPDLQRSRRPIAEAVG